MGTLQARRGQLGLKKKAIELVAELLLYTTFIKRNRAFLTSSHFQ